MRSRDVRVVGGVTGNSPPTWILFGGDEWTVTRTAAGQYQVRFLRPFRRPPTVTATIYGSGQAAYLAMVTNVNEAGFLLVTELNGAWSDLSVAFTAVGYA